jgi:hypothetical protein
VKIIAYRRADVRSLGRAKGVGQQRAVRAFWTRVHLIGPALHLRTRVNTDATTSNRTPQTNNGPASGLQPAPVITATAENCGPPVGAHAEGLVITMCAPNKARSATTQAPSPTPKHQLRVVRNRSRRTNESSCCAGVTVERSNVRDDAHHKERVAVSGRCDLHPLLWTLR